MDQLELMRSEAKQGVHAVLCALALWTLAWGAMYLLFLSRTQGIVLPGLDWFGGLFLLGITGLPIVAAYEMYRPVRYLLAYGDVRVALCSLAFGFFTLLACPGVLLLFMFHGASSLFLACLSGMGLSAGATALSLRHCNR